MINVIIEVRPKLCGSEEQKVKLCLSNWHEPQTGYNFGGEFGDESEFTHHQPSTVEGWGSIPGRKDNVCRSPEPQKRFLRDNN